LGGGFPGIGLQFRKPPATRAVNRSSSTPWWSPGTGWGWSG
jgi:hypothetical protein